MKIPNIVECLEKQANILQELNIGHLIFVINVDADRLIVILTERLWTFNLPVNKIYSSEKIWQRFCQKCTCTILWNSNTSTLAFPPLGRRFEWIQCKR